ncbi:MAG: hypothetical protein HYZ08_03095 [Candidatus Kerfeldbacteria bacterium]|nr:hypothetical protein [Candidatus Kerfeldbacteria bacterium]
METTVSHQWNWVITTPLARIFTISALLVVILHIALVLYKVEPTEDLVFLHYTTVLGVDDTGAWYGFFVAPLSGVILFVVNLLMAAFRSDRFSAFVFLIFNLIAQAMLAAGSVLLLLKNA